MNSKSGLQVVVSGLILMLLSCKAPVSFDTEASSSVSADSSAALSSEALSTEDQEVIDSLCQRVDADSQNAFEGNVYDKPFLNFAFSGGGKGLYKPHPKCTTVTILEDSDVKRDILYTYDCTGLRGTVQQTTEMREASIYSTTKQDITMIHPKETRSMRSVEAQEKFKAGSLIIDQEFEENFTRGSEEHVITGVNSYDYAADQTEDEDGAVQIIANSGVVQLSGNFEHIKNGATQSVRTVISNNLHRSACGFDEGSITVRSAEKSITITYTGCGKRTFQWVPASYSGSSK